MTRRYFSAEHAAASYAHLLTSLGGLKAIDYSRPLIQCQAAKENPALEGIDDFHELKKVLAKSEPRAGERWIYWWLVRVECVSQRTVARAARLGRTTVARYVESVDAAVEQILFERGLLIRSQARLEAVAYV